MTFGDINLLQCDCMEYMATLPDKAFQLAIVDPPYGIDINMNMGRRAGKAAAHKKKPWDKSTPDEKYFDELFRVSNFQIIWGGQLFSSAINKVLDILG